MLHSLEVVGVSVGVVVGPFAKIKKYHWNNKLNSLTSDPFIFVFKLKYRQRHLQCSSKLYELLDNF